MGKKRVREVESHRRRKELKGIICAEYIPKVRNLKIVKNKVENNLN